MFSANYWTFWDVFFLFFIWIPLIMTWFFAIFDCITRRTLSGWAKVGWLALICIFPLIGTVCYLIFRPIEEYPRSSTGYYGQMRYYP